MAKNYYEILGVDKKATQDEIKSAYRKLVKQYHPDLHPNDEAAAAKFKEINEANETLSDEQKRAAYDYELEHPGTGELVLCSIFFPEHLAVAFPIALALGNLVDPPATMVNSAGDYVASFIVSRFVDGKDWLQKQLSGTAEKK